MKKEQLQDLIVSILEAFFKVPVTLKTKTYPCESLGISRNKANAINYLKRYACVKVGLKCCYVADLSKKYTTLRARFDEMLSQAMRSIDDNFYCFLVPDKSRASVEVPKPVVVPESTQRYYESIERLQMEAEDILLHEKEYNSETTESYRRIMMQNRQILDIKYSQPETTQLSYEDLIITPTAFKDDEKLRTLFGAIHDTIFKSRNKLGLEEVKRMREHNADVERINTLISHRNKKKFADYKKKIALVEERNQMLMEDHRASQLRKKEKFIKIRNRVIEKNEIIADAAEGKRRLRAQAVRDSESSLARINSRDANIFDLASWLKVAQLKIRGALTMDYIRREGFPEMIAGSILQDVTMAVSGRRVIHLYHEGQKVSDLLRPELDRLCLSLEVGDYPVTHPEWHRLIVGSEFLAKLLYRCQRSIREAAIIKERARIRSLLEVIGLPRRQIAVPSIDKFNRAIDKTPKLLEMPKPPRKEQLKQYVEIPSLGTIDEMDFYAILTGCVGEQREGRFLIKSLFGTKPKCNLATLRREHADLINDIQPTIWEMVSDWILGVASFKSFERQLARVTRNRLIEHHEQGWEGYYRSKSAPYYKYKAIPYPTEDYIKRVEERWVDSIDESNLFYQNIRLLGYSKCLVQRNFHSEVGAEPKQRRRKRPKAPSESKREKAFQRAVTGWEYLRNEKPIDYVTHTSQLWEVRNRYRTRAYCRKVVSTVGTYKAADVGTHGMELLIYSGNTREFIPKYEVMKYTNDRIFKHRSRSLFHSILWRTD